MAVNYIERAFIRKQQVGSSLKDFAMRFTSRPHPAILFATLDGNAELVDSLIWEECKKLAKEARPLWEATDGEE